MPSRADPLTTGANRGRGRLALLSGSRERMAARPYRWAALMLVMLLAATAAATAYTATVSRDDSRRIGEHEADGAVQTLDRRVQAYGELLTGMRALLAVDPDLSQAMFGRYVRSLRIDARYPGLRFVGFARALGTADLPGFRRAARQPSSARDRRPAFTIHPRIRQSRHLVMDYVEPLRSNEAALGFDLLSDLKRLGAMLQTQRTNAPAATAPLSLVQDPQGNRGFVLMLAVRRAAPARARPGAGGGELLGVVTAGFETRDLLDATFMTRTRKLGLTVYDVGASPASRYAAPSSSNEIYAADDPAGDGLDHGYVTRSLDVGGRRWILRYALSAAPGAALPWVVAIGGALASLLAAWLLLGFAHGRARAVSLAERMTGDLARQRTQLANAQVIARLGSWEWDVRTDHLEWSDELCRIYGLEPGTQPTDFAGYLATLHPDDRALAETAVGEAHATGRPFAFRHRIVRPDGSLRVLQGNGEIVTGDDGEIVRMVGTGQDITEREAMVAELRRTSRHFELARDLAVTTGFDGFFTSVNPVVTELLGWAPEEFLSRPFIDMVHPDDRTATLREVEGLADGKVTFSFVNRYECKDGSYRWLDWNAIVPPDEELIYGSARDVTERRQAALELASSESRTRRIIETAHDGFVSIDGEGIITDWNPQAEAMFGWSRDEALGRELAATIVPVEERSAHRQGLRRIADGAESKLLGTLIELVAVHRNGKEFPVELTISSMPTGGGNAFNAFVRDISERRAAEEDVQRSRRLLADLLESAPDAVVIADERGRITLVNEQTERVFGYPRAELVGAQIESLLPVRDPDPGSDPLEGAHARPLVVGEELVGLRHDGTEFPVAVSMSAVKTREGRLVTAFVRDITARMQIAAELAAAHERAVEGSRMKSEFVANMSHEIRTPLNGVIGMSGLLLDTDLSAEQREYAEEVRASGDALMAVIEDILDFSKIEAGKLELDRRAFHLRELVEDAATMVATKADEKGLELMTWVDDDIPNGVCGDGPRVRQVVLNLLTNAVKFTSAGEVVVHVSREPHSGGRVALRIEVSDTGIGIDRLSQERIFDSFSQADSSTTRRYGGTGLGLTICKQLVRLMGGEIGVRSARGAGSTFWFTFVLDEDPSADAPAADSRLDGVRALIVDDSQTNRMILTRQMSSWGMVCRAVHDGASALEALSRAAADDEHYDLVVLDARMPRMTGLELATAIKADPALRPPRLLMLTSSGDGRAAAARAGLDGFVVKPVREARLRRELSVVLGGGSAPAPTSPVRVEGLDAVAVAAGPTRGPVLVADDKAVNQLVAKRLLQKRGFEVDLASNGLEAVDMHRRGHYEAIFMDCQMPELDGYEATVAIRLQEGGERHTPIIAMTASTVMGEQERCLRAGMDAYLGKPLDPAVLDAMLVRQLHNGGAVPAPKRPAPKRPPQVAGARDGGEPLLDQAAFSDVCEGDEQLREQLLGLFVEESRITVAALAAAVAAGDDDGARRAAHALKGSAAVVGAVRLSSLAAAIDAGNGSRRPAELSRLRDELVRVHELTVAALLGDDAPVTRPDRRRRPRPRSG